MATETIASRLQTQGRVRPEGTAYAYKEGGQWRNVSWSRYAAEVRTAGRAMMALGVKPGHAVCILGFNRPEWAIFDIAALSIGAAPAGIYTTSSPAEVQYITHHCEAPLVLVEDVAQWEKVREKRAELPHLRRVITMRGCPAIGDPMVMSWEAFLAEARGVTDVEFAERMNALEPSGLATFIYTSGTTGPPKGVMLSHENLAWTSKVAVDLTQVGEQDRVLSYLPLSHIAEQMFTLHAAISAGYAVYFAESLEKLKDNLTEVRPTLFFGVPRIWEKLHAGIQDKLSKAPALRKALAEWAIETGRKAWAARFEGREPSVPVRLQYGLAQKLVYGKVKGALGLDQARMCVSGAAPIAKEVLSFFTGIDLPIYEVYGQSEGTGPTSFNRPGLTRLGTVGPAYPGVEIRIAADDEIQFRGPNVFLGYYKEPEATADVLHDGWLFSGDLGALDSKGFLTITGRKKDILITAGGKNIAPKNIEAAIKNIPIVGEAVVVGDRRKFLTALITLDDERRHATAAELNIGPQDVHEHPSVVQLVQAGIDKVNEELARVEQVKRFRILPRPFSPMTGELTPTLKVKRSVVYTMYAGIIEEMYADGE